MGFLNQQLRIIHEPDRNVLISPIQTTMQATSLGVGAQRKNMQLAGHMISKHVKIQESLHLTATYTCSSVVAESALKPGPCDSVLVTPHVVCK